MMQQLFSHQLRRHFIKTTVLRNYAFVETEITAQKVDNPTRIDPKEPYQLFIFKDEDSEAIEIDQKLSPTFESFIQDGQKWASSANEADQKRVFSVMEDYMIMRRAAREETQILTLNKVGIERDQKKMRENVAKHVGLQMPKEFKD